MRDVGVAVVGHDPLDSDVASSVPGHAAAEKSDGRLGPFVGKHLRVGEARVVIDADVSELPADVADPLRLVAVDPMSNSLNTSEFLSVDVQELARRCALVATLGLFGLQPRQPGQAETAKDARDGRSGNRHALGD